MRCPSPRKHGLELSRRGQSLWREPRSKRRKASAPPKMARAAQQMSERVRAHRSAQNEAIVGMRLSALRLPSYAGGESILLRRRTQKLGRICAARTMSYVVIARLKARSPVFTPDVPAIHAGRRLAETSRHRLIRGSLQWTTGSSPMATRKIREGQNYCAMVSETVGRPSASCASRPNRY
jgi:hypothetical protein